jgi:hypothetical protein
VSGTPRQQFDTPICRRHELVLCEAQNDKEMLVGWIRVRLCDIAQEALVVKNDAEKSAAGNRQREIFGAVLDCRILPKNLKSCFDASW